MSQDLFDEEKVNELKDPKLAAKAYIIGRKNNLGIAMAPNREEVRKTANDLFEFLANKDCKGIDSKGCEHFGNVVDWNETPSGLEFRLVTPKNPSVWITYQSLSLVA